MASLDFTSGCFESISTRFVFYMKWALMGCVCAFLFSSLSAKRNIEVWNSEGIYLPFSSKIGGFGNFECRSKKTRKTIYYRHYQGGIYFIVSPYTFFYLAYRHVLHHQENKWVLERTPLIDWTVQMSPFQAFYLSYRNRVQYPFLNQKKGKKERWLYRGRLEWAPPSLFARQSLFPYFATEFFWKQGKGIEQNRIEGGLKMPYHERACLTLSYLHCASSPFANEKKWVQTSIIRFDFSLRF